MNEKAPQTLSLSKGFTIVELLVVIVVIGILAAITIVSYTGISSKANTASIQSDLNNAKKQLNLYFVDNGAYPASLDGSNCPVSPVDIRYCLKPSSGTTLVYSNLGNATSPQGFGLTATKNSTSYILSNTKSPAVISIAPTIPTLSCPTGFIPVPGSITYGQADFCVMKYEAKDAGGNVPVSQAAGSPWASVSQTNAASYSQNVVACTGCHLISETEWLTIAQNVLSVPSNWSDGTVGSGYIPRGNSNGSAANDATVDLTGVNKRTLTLSNGEIIWDLAGNASEWTSGQTTGGQPGVTGDGLNTYEWTAIINPGTISPNPSAATTSITGTTNASTWASSNGIGQIFSDANDTNLRGFIRGGAYSHASFAGVLTLSLNLTPSFSSVGLGFRVARP